VRRSNNRSMRRDPVALPSRQFLSALLRRWSSRLPESVADRALILATLIAILLVGGSTVAIMRSEPSYAEAAFDAPTLVDTDSPTTTVTAAEVAPAPAPEPVSRPIAPPSDPRAPTPIVQIGEIRIPKIGLVHPIFEGVTLTVIDHGPGHWPGSAIPGQLGNMVFAGHRVTHSHPFRNIDKLVPGDEVFFRDKDGEWRYIVTGHEVVKPQDVHIVTPTPNATMTLFACHPPGRAIQRYVVRGVFDSKTA
jgi:sortase A